MPVYAGTSASVTINVVPLVSGGVSNFTIIPVSDKQVNMTWDKGAGTNNVMIRGKYGRYPANIPDILTAPSDGYLVYYGSDLSASDTNVNLDFDDSSTISDTSDTPFTIYYRIWGQNADGTWQTSTQSGSEETNVLILLSLILFAGILTTIGYVFKLDFMKFISGLGWIFVGVYMNGNYTWFGTAQWTTILICFFGLALPIWIHTLWTMSINRKDKLAKANALYTEGEGDEDDEDAKQTRSLMEKYAKKPTRRSQKRDSLFGG
jgi:hypothetical protein